MKFIFLKKLKIIRRFLRMSESNKFTKKIMNTPDLTQTDPDGNLPDGGKQYCAPVSVSNSFMWLGKNGFPKLIPIASDEKTAQLEMARILGSKKYMNTSIKNGTKVSGVLNGVSQYVKKRGYQYSRLEYQGWGKHPKEFKTRKKVPDMNWVKQGILGNSVAWLNIGWYKYKSETDEYHRNGGHWVTLVGFGIDEKEKKKKNMLIIHDPAPQAGKFFANEFVAYEKIESGKLTGVKPGLPRSAIGYYKLTSGMHIKKGADFAILDGVVTT